MARSVRAGAPSRCAAVMKSIALDLTPPRKKPTRTRGTASGAAVAIDPTDAGLVADLKALRLEIAREIDKPAYVVFSDATLADMAKKRPLDAAAFLTVDGVGQTKCSLYAERFIDRIRAFAD